MAARETLGVAIVGAGWCASQHIAAFQRNPRTRITWICGRDLERTRAAAASAGAIDNVRITTDFEAVLAAARRRHRVDHDAEPSARRPGGCRRARPASTSCSRSRPDSTPPELVRIRDAVRSAGVRTIVSFELHYNPLPEVRALAARRQAGSATSGSRARSICPASPTGMPAGTGSAPARAAAAICSPPAAMPWMPFAAARASSRPRSARSIRISPRATSGRPRSSSNMRLSGGGARSCQQLDRFHDAVYVPRRADGRPRELRQELLQSLTRRSISRPCGRESVSRRALRSRRRRRGAARRSASTARCPTRPT